MRRTRMLVGGTAILALVPSFAVQAKVNLGGTCTQQEHGRQDSGLSCVQTGAKTYLWASVSPKVVKKDVYVVGDTAKSSDVEFTVHSVTDPWTSDNPFVTPNEGLRFVALDVSIRNTGKRRLSFSSVLQVDAQTVDDRVWSVSINASVAAQERGMLNGDLLAGQVRRGGVVVEVPVGVRLKTVRFKGSLTSAGATFSLVRP